MALLRPASSSASSVARFFLASYLQSSVGSSWRQRGQELCWFSHGARQGGWKTWLHGMRWTTSPTTICSLQRRNAIQEPGQENLPLAKQT